MTQFSSFCFFNEIFRIAKSMRAALFYVLLITNQPSLINCVTELHPETAIKPSTTRGMVIDVGSGGSRLHLYHWNPRVFKTIPPSISVPSSG